MIRRSHRFAVLLATALASLSVLAADPSAVSEFSIAAQPLSTALIEFSKQANIQVLTAGHEVEGTSVPAVTGRLTLATALERMLKDSGFSYRFVDNKTLTLTRVAPERPADVPQMAEPTQPADRPMLSEVVVSATKRESSISDVPVAIQVFGEETMQKLGIKDFADYAQYVPGVSFTKRGAGQTHVVMRGLSTGSVASGQPQNRALVGIYLDDVPIQLNGFNFDPDLFDMARVEVLKGPQGTLYGDSAMAGAIRYVSTPPSLTKHSARVNLTGSSTKEGGGNYAVRAAGNLPLMADTLGLRAVVWHRNEEGWIDSLRTGRADVNTEKISGGRISALWQATEDLSVQAMLLAQRSRLGSRPESELGVGEWVQDRNPEPFEDDALMANVSVNWLLPSLSLTSVTGFLDRDLRNVYSTQEGSFERFFGVRFPNTMLVEPWTQRFLTQEFRVTSRGEKRVDYTAGVFLSRFDVDFLSLGSADGFSQHLVDQGIVPSLDAVYSLGCAPPEQRPDLWFCGPLETSQEQTSVFGEVTVHVTDKVDLLIGARYFDWEQEFAEDYGGFFNGGRTTKQQTVAEDGINPRFGLNYSFGDDSLAFLNAAKGFRLGGVNDPLPVLCDDEVAEAGLGNVDRFDKDSLWTYEAGVKLPLARRRVLLNASAFLTEWDDVQTTRSLNCGYAIIQNAGKVLSRGLEFDSTVAVSRQFRFLLSGSYTDARLDANSPNLGASKGDAVPFVPRWKVAAFVLYEQPLSAVWKGFADFGVTTQGESFTTFSPLASNRLRLPGSSVATLRIGAQAERYRIALFADNLTNERAVYDAGRQGATTYFTYARPRTVGLELGVYFD